MLEFNKELITKSQGYEFRIDVELSDPNENIEVYKLFDSDTEMLLDAITVGVDSGLIYGVSCCSLLKYNSINILGLPIIEVLLLLGKHHYSIEDFEVIDDWKLIYTFDKLGLMLWVDNGIVESADCLSCDED